MMSTHYDQVLDAKSVKPAARNQWKTILESLGIESKFLVKRHGQCPSCGGKDRFRFDDKNGHGTFYCNKCGSGDGFKMLMNINGWTFPQALKAVSDALGGVGAPLLQNRARRLVSDVQKVDIDAYENIWALWNSGEAISEDDLAWKYFRNTRGIKLTEFPEVLKLQSCKFGRAKILCAFTNSRDELVQVQSISINKEALKASDKKLFQGAWHDGGDSPLRGGAIKLYEPSDELAIGEGVESCLAFHAQYQIPIWAATGKDLLKSVSVPDHVKRVIIAADNDANCDGEKAAEILAKKLAKQGKTVEIWMPETVGHDFADEALAS